MTLHSIYTTQTSRHERLTYFSHAIEKETGRSLAFQSLDKKDRIAFLALCNISSSTINWNKIGKQKLGNTVRHLLDGPKLPNPLQLPSQDVTKAHLSPFLTGEDLANLQSTYKAASKLGSATSIIRTYGLAPFIARYFYRYCDTLTEDEKIRVLHQLMAFAKDLSELEHLEAPNYQSAAKFFELVEARNLLRLAHSMHNTLPLVGLQGAPLEIAEDSEGTLQRAEKIREWFRQHQSDLKAFNRLFLREYRLTLLPPEIGQLTSMEDLALFANRLTCLPKEIGQLGALTGLGLDQNRLTRLPKEMGRLGALTGLGLYHNDLTRLPKEIGQLKALTVLGVSYNRLINLPKEIGQLGALIKLDLGHNNLARLSKMITQLGTLQYLRLNNNRLTHLPKEIGRLRALKYLNLEDNRLKSLPKEIGQLRALLMLSLISNRLTSLPKEIGQLRALTGFYLRNNHLTRIPKEIGQLRAMTSLALMENRLRHLPKEIGQLKALAFLGLSDNLLAGVPKEIGQLKVLKHLLLANNCLANLPKEIGQLRALQEYFTISENGLIDLPAGLERYTSQLPQQNKALQMKTILGRLRRYLKGKHDCKDIAMLLNRMEKIQGKEMRSKLHACIHNVCKKEKALHKKMKSPHFGRKAFLDPSIDPKFKLAALERFEHNLLAKGS